MTQGSKYSDEIKDQAVIEYCITGNVEKVCKSIGVPKRTVYEWITKQWFIDKLANLRTEKDQELDALYTETIQLAKEKALERLRDGDYAKHDADGNVLYKPVSAKDCTMVAAIDWDKRTLQRGGVTSRTEKVSTDKMLDGLTERFTQVSNLAKSQDDEQVKH